MAGPDDNILGGQDAVIRVGVEADMSEILQQATKFNELIKDANDSFNVMQTVITSTTTRMASLNSATLRLVSSARQLRSEYQLIAESSQRIGFLGDGVGEEGPIGIGGKALGDLVSGVGGPFRETAGGVLAPASMAGVSGAAEMPEPFPGLEKAIPGLAKEGGEAMGSYSSTAGGLSTGSEYKEIAKKSGLSTGQGISAMLAEMVRGGSSPGQMVKAVMGFIMPKLGPAMAALSPYALPTIGAAVAGYKALDYMIKGSTKYTGLTGGTGVYTSLAEDDYSLGMFGGINKGSFLGLQASKWLPGLLNMAVGPGGYGEIQEGLLTAGYKPYGDAQQNRMGMQGMRWDQARGTLATLYAKGYQDVGANIALMQTSIESARTSTASFTSSMDQLRITAQRTNASMKGLTTAFTTMMKALAGGLGATGNWTNLYSVAAANAYANSRNAALRDGGAVADLSQFQAQVQLMMTPAFQSQGINFNNALQAYSNKPGMAETMALGTDQAVDRLLAIAGIPDLRGKDPRLIEKIIRDNSIRVLAMRDTDLAKGLVGPEVLNDANAWVEFLVANAKGDPTISALNKLKQETGANKIKGYRTADLALETLLGDQQSASRGRVSDFLGLSPEEQERYQVLDPYYDYIGETRNSIGWLTSIMRAGDQDKTWVKYRGERMKLGKFMTDYGFDSPEARRLIESGNLQIATAQGNEMPDLGDFSAAYNTVASEKTVQNMTQTELRDTFKGGMTDWAKDNNSAGDNKLKVGISVDGLPGI